MKSLFYKLISASEGRASSTRLIYLVSGLAAVFCAMVMTIGGILEYCGANGKADPVYWTAVAALWTAKLGFGAQEKNHQQRCSTERAKAQYRHAMEPAVSESQA